MERIINISKNHKEADDYDFHQLISMTPEQRHKIAFQLKKRFYGDNCIDVRESRKVVIKCNSQMI